MKIKKEENFIFFYQILYYFSLPHALKMIDTVEILVIDFYC